MQPLSMGQLGLPSAVMMPLVGAPMTTGTGATLGATAGNSAGTPIISLTTIGNNLPVINFSMAPAPAPAQASQTVSIGGTSNTTSFLMAMMNQMNQMMQMMGQMMQLVMGGVSNVPGMTLPGTNRPGSTTPIGNMPNTQPVKPTLTQDDLVNFVLAGSRGGTTTTDQAIDGRFANPNSRFAQAGANEFDAVVAKAYAAQFKAYALGLNVVFNPGDNPQTTANNIMTGQMTTMKPEAELLAHVAATYRGDFGGASVYNNPALKQLLVSWGRSDLANQPLVGVTDVQSVGSVIRALNEQPDPTIRQTWLQQIFDFQNNTPSSPSGAVPSLPQYQVAVAMVKNGILDQLIVNYQNGVKTSGPINLNATPGGTTQPGNTTPPTNTISTPDIDRNIAFQTLSKEQRSQIGLSDRDRAIIHLWGRQVISRGFQDGGIYFNVLQTEPNRFTPAEKDLIQQLATQEQAEFGGITGKALDREFFALMQRMNPEVTPDVSKWLNAPARASLGPVNIVSDLNTLQQQTGLSEFDQAVLRLWGHEPLFNGGKIDGSILAYTIGNPNALDNSANPSNKGQNVTVDGVAQALLNADFASDGVRNGDSLRFAFGRVLDHIYLGAADPTVDTIQANAQQKAAQNGRSLQQISQDVQQGMTQALADAASMVKDHPIIAAASIGGVAAATAICPFLGGLAIGGAGIAAGQAFMNGQTNPAANPNGA